MTSAQKSMNIYRDRERDRDRDRDGVVIFETFEQARGVFIFETWKN